MVICSHHLNPRFWSGGFLLNGSIEPSIYKLSSRTPRFLQVRIRTFYCAVMHILQRFFFPHSWGSLLHLHHDPFCFHIHSNKFFQIKTIRLFSFRMHCISYWMRNNGLLWPDISLILPVYTPTWQETTHIHCHVHLFWNSVFRHRLQVRSSTHTASYISSRLELSLCWKSFLWSLASFFSTLR